MKRTAISCDGARLPRRCTQDDTWDVRRATSNASEGDATIRIPSLSLTLLSAVPKGAIDLARIASFAYWADQMVSRPVAVDVSGEQWRRHFLLSVPVLDAELWKSVDVQQALGTVLSYGTDDSWEFEFERGEDFGQRCLFKADPPLVGDPACVLLFSGGTDSLCAAVQEGALGRRPLLISHSPDPRSRARQDKLRGELVEWTPGWHFPSYPFEINKRGEREKENTQRTRGFLYSAVGASVAASFGLTDVVVADNGWVSVGLPINGQAISAKMSRTTHPRFQYLFNRLLDLVAPGVRVRNPLLFLTRAEALEMLKTYGAAQLVRLTHSCAAERRAAGESQCGVCSQCIDRRVGVAAAGLQAHDRLYHEDVFLGDLQGDALMRAESYVRLMRRLLKQGPDEVVRDHVELVDCAHEGESGSPEAVRSIAAMTVRQAATIQSVLVEAAEPVMAELMAGEYPNNSMVRLALSGKAGAKVSRWRRAQEPDVSLTEADEALFRRHAYLSRLPIHVTGRKSTSESYEVKLGDLPVYLRTAEMVLLLRLIVEIARGGEGWCPKGDGKMGGGLVAEDMSPPDVANAILRLRRSLQPGLGALNPVDIIQVNRGAVRLSTLFRFVRVDRELLAAHPDQRVRSLLLDLPFDVAPAV